MKTSSTARTAGQILPLVAALLVGGCALRPAALAPDPPLPPWQRAPGELVPPEVKGPVNPPIAVYRVVLDSVAAHMRRRAERGVTFYVEPAGLPDGIGRRELSERGLRTVDANFRCGKDGWVAFGAPRRFADGTYLIPTMESIGGFAGPIDYAIREVEGAFRSVMNQWTFWHPDYIVGCPEPRR